MDQFDSAIREIYENYYYEEDVETVLEKLKNYKRFIIFGAGRLGHQVYDILAKREQRLHCFVTTGYAAKQMQIPVLRL